MSNRVFILAAAALTLCGAPQPARAQEAKGGQVVTGFINKTLNFEGKNYPYVVYVPRNYDGGKRWPVILFLHGAGERGSEGLSQSQVGLGGAIRMRPERWPAIAVFPQCEKDNRWDGAMARMALKSLDQTMYEYSTDPNRQYLTGLSMGGYGSWLIASEHPDRFAAVAPICGGGSPEEMAKKLTGVPIWAFHGDRDRAVPVERSRQMVQAIKDAGGKLIQYTEYPGVEHNSWDPAYNEAEFAAWMFEQHRHR